MPNILKYGQVWWSSLSKQEKEDALEPLIKARKSNLKICEQLGLNSPNQVAGVRKRVVARYPEYKGGSIGAAALTGERSVSSSSRSFIHLGVTKKADAMSPRAALPTPKPEEKPERSIFDTRLGAPRRPELEVHEPINKTRPFFRIVPEKRSRIRATASDFLYWRKYRYG